LYLASYFLSSIANGSLLCQTLFPYELFVKLYDKIELHPFGLNNLGNR